MHNTGPHAPLGEIRTDDDFTTRTNISPFNEIEVNFVSVLYAGSV